MDIGTRYVRTLKKLEAPSTLNKKNSSPPISVCRSNSVCPIMRSALNCRSSKSPLTNWQKRLKFIIGWTLLPKFPLTFHNYIHYTNLCDAFLLYIFRIQPGSRWVAFFISQTENFTKLIEKNQFYEREK